MATKYAYEFGKRWNVKTPRASIKWLINREHVSATYEDIDKLISDRLADAGPEFTPAIKRQCLSYARCVHHANRNLYVRVTRGR